MVSITHTIGMSHDMAITHDISHNMAIACDMSHDINYANMQLSTWRWFLPIQL